MTTTTLNEDRRRVLDLLAQGKITVPEAEGLLGAIGDQGPDGPAAAELGAGGAAGRFLRIEVEKQGRHGVEPRRVNIRLPYALVRSGMRLGALLHGVGGRNGALQERLRARGVDVDFSQLDPAQLDALLESAGEMTIDVDNGRATIRMTRE